MTGAMPLVDDQALSDEFSLPDYEDEGVIAADGDFASDLDSDYGRGESSAGEEHADEISKILTETDVYLKYGLHQKAVEHLRRVFALDPENTEAREKLKEVYLAQGREDEAVEELVKLAEALAPSDPERAEAYLREVLSIDGSHRGRARAGPPLPPRPVGRAGGRGHRQRRRHRARSRRADLGPGRRGRGRHRLRRHRLRRRVAAGARVGQARGGRADSFDGIDPAVFGTGGQADLAHGRSPQGRRRGSDMELEPASDPTRQVDADEVRALAEMSGVPEPLEFEAGVVEHAVAARGLGSGRARRRGRGPARRLARRRHRRGRRGRARRGRRPSIDGLDDDLPFDPEAARAFDAGVARARRAERVRRGQRADVRSGGRGRVRRRAALRGAADTVVPGRRRPDRRLVRRPRRAVGRAPGAAPARLPPPGRDRGRRAPRGARAGRRARRRHRGLDHRSGRLRADRRLRRGRRRGRPAAGRRELARGRPRRGRLLRVAGHVRRGGRAAPRRPRAPPRPPAGQRQAARRRGLRRAGRRRRPRDGDD